MPRILPTTLLLVCAALTHAVETALPLDAGSIQVPAGWSLATREPLVLLGPGTGGTASRLALSTSSADGPTTAQALRDGYRRVTDGCEILDDDDVPLGGRIWRRLRVRFATGPLVFGQVAWIGTVGSRTVVAILSAPDERVAAAMPAATDALSGISAPR